MRQTFRATQSAPARQTYSRTFLESLFWGVGMAASLLLSVEYAMAGYTANLPELLALFFVGGLTAFPIARFVAQSIARNRPVEACFCAAFVCLAVSTIAITALFFAIVNWHLSSDWNGPLLTRTWLSQISISFAAAIYQFAVVGSRMYLPLGAALLVVMSIRMARQSR